ncbi:MAG: serine/threonine-protein kinase [Steroidobacter sp.]
MHRPPADEAETLVHDKRTAVDDECTRFEGAATELREHPDDAATRTAALPHAPSRDSLASRTLEPGTRLRGRYVLEAPIGQGAMGQVWRARDLLSEEARDRNPYVAIKVLLSDVERHPQSFAAMHREASRTQKLAHPNIVTVHSLDRDEPSGRVFISMELLEGEPLDRVIQRLREEGIAPANPWSIIKGLAEGLAYAHGKGIVHSDFKPGNVFLTAEGAPKILDFGIARAAHRADASRNEAPGNDDSVISGYTERYAAPEVFLDAAPHTASDVFSLGLVAYELLTGEHALGRRSSAEASRSGFRPAPIKGVTRREQRILERALAYDLKERWQDAREFLEALQKRMRLQIALAASVVALVITAGGLSYRNYLDGLPNVPLEQLPHEQQQEVRSALAEGNDALRYVRDSRLIEASADAADRFADAYAIHARNPDAVAGLEAAASYFIEWWEEQPDRERALTELRKFQAKSEFYRGYAPLKRAIKRLE